MFEAFVLVCLMGTNNICHTLQDLEGPYKTEKEAREALNKYCIEELGIDIPSSDGVDGY